MPDLPERRPRKDVARNRARLLTAAREVFAVHGLDATLDDIARHGGLGTGTAYRHFGSRQEILHAIFSEVAQSFVADAEAALTAPDPWDALRTFLETSAERQAQDRGLHQAFLGRHGTGVTPQEWTRLSGAVSKLLERAQAAGAVRTDVEPADLFVMLAMLGPAYDISAATSSEVWRRQLAIYLAGLRSGELASTLATVPAPGTAVLGAATAVRG